MWLINPAGIVFGPSASLNVGGSVHFSTADYLRLGSGNDRFYADLGKTSQLTSAAVTAFGFLGNSPGKIDVQGGLGAPTLSVPTGQTFSLVGGDISITSRTISSVGGPVNLISTASAGEVVRNSSIGTFTPPALTGFTQFGKIILNNASVDTSTNKRMSTPDTDVNNIPIAAGSVYIRAGQLEMSDSSLKATSRGFVFKGKDRFDPNAQLLDTHPGGDVQAGGVTITNDQFTFTNSLIRTGSLPPDLPPGFFSFGQAGRGLDNLIKPGTINLNVGALVADGSRLDTGSSLEQAVAGRLNIQGIGEPAPEARLVNLQASTINDLVGLGSGRGAGGGVTINAREVLIDRSTYTGASGDQIASDFAILSSDRIHIQDSTLTHPGLGAAGAMTLSAGNEITLLATTLQTTNKKSDSPGAVTLTAPVITMQGGKILTDSPDNQAPPITFNVGDLNIGAFQTGTTIEPALVSSSGISVGSPGTITVQGIGVNGSPPPPATHMVIDNSTLSTTTVSRGVADRTRISISAQNIDLTNGAQVKADTIGAGPAGKIILNGGGAISLANGAAISSSSIAILPQGSTPGSGDAGDITIVSGDSISVANSSVSTSATQASGGNIILTAPNMVRLVGANLTSSVNGPANSNGGNITIDTAHPQFVIMQGNSQILAKANEGQGGRITIIGAVVLQEPGSVLDATAGPAGISGSINIQAPFQQLSGAIAPLPQAFAVATNLYGQRCAAEKGGQFSSFVQGARDGVPPQPGDLIPSPLVLDFDESTSSTSDERPAAFSDAISQTAKTNQRVALPSVRNLSSTRTQLLPSMLTTMFQISRDCGKSSLSYLALE